MSLFSATISRWTLLLVSLLLGFTLGMGAVHAQEDVSVDEASTEEVAADAEEAVAEESEEESEEQLPTIKEDEAFAQIGGLYLRAGNLLRITEPVTRDVFTAGLRVDVNERVEGDIFAAGQDVTINEEVIGSVRAAGNTIIIDSRIDGNVLAFGSSITVTEDAVITGHLNAYGATVVIDGQVDKSVHAAGAVGSFAGQLNGEVSFEGDSLSIENGALLMDDLTVIGPTEPVIGEDVTGAELVTYEFREYENQRSVGAGRAIPLGALYGGIAASIVLIFVYWFIAMSIVGLLMIRFWPKTVDKMIDSMHTSFDKTLLRGVAGVFLIPVITVLVAITVIGLPLAGVLFLFYILSMVIAPLVAALCLGKWLLEKLGNETTSPYWQFLFGYFVLMILLWIPLVGALVRLVAFIWGMGGILHVLMDQAKKKK